MSKFIKNKSVGYFIAIADAVLALVLAIIYMATYKSAIGNNAGGQLPETVGIFMFAGFAAQLVILLLPQYSFLNLAPIAMYSISFYKELYLIPDFIAGKVNNVEYNGGDFGLNMFYFILQLIILISAIVATFIGFYKNKKDADEDFKLKLNVPSIVKCAVGLALIVGASVGGAVATNGVQKAEQERIEQARIEAEKLAEYEKWATTFNPITDDVKAKADEVEYTFDPAEVLIKEQETYNYSDSALTSLTDSKTRADHNLVYYFEGSYREGYQGDYSATYAHIYLWDDGLFIGKAGDTTFKGYWFNSSLQNGTDDSGNDIKDCLTMVSNTNKYEQIDTTPIEGFYTKQAWIYLGFSWGTRSMGVSGFLYYPEVDIAIHMGVRNDHVYHVGDEFTKNTLKVYRILKDLNFGAVFVGDNYSITLPEGMVVDGRLAAAGEYTITATYNGFTTTKTITVVE